MGGIQAQSTSRPYGKWATYQKDGKQIQKEGIYLGDNKQWNRCLKAKTIKDFYTNETPKLSIG